MAGSSDKKEGFMPERRNGAVQQTAPTPTEDSITVAETGSTSKSPLLDQARQFLDDDSIRDAARDRKVAFLQRKGVRRDDIEKLLGSEPLETASPVSSQAGQAMKTIHDSITHSGTPTSRQQPAISHPTPSSPTTSVAPIITYPEFLIQPQKPPPLVTFQRLAYASYVLAGISAITYGASKYLVQPMLESLTSARHDMAILTLQELGKMNNKLEANVSHLPATCSTVLLKHVTNGDHACSEDDADTVDSDPTELFHRDIATQTTPHISRAASVSSSDTAQHSANTMDPLTHQSTRLSTLHLSLTSLLDSSKSVAIKNDAMKETVTEVQTYVDYLQFSESGFNHYHDLYPGWEAQKQSGKGRKFGESEDDEVAKFKSEIRAVKGALLSTRNFPIGRGIPVSSHGVGVG